MQGYRRFGALLAAMIVWAGCQAIEPRVQQMSVDNMAKNDAVFDKDGVRRKFPSPLDVVNEAVDRTLAEQGVYTDGANLDFAVRAVKDQADRSPVPTNSHVKTAHNYGMAPNGHRMTTSVVSNRYRMVAVRIVETNDGCDVITYVHADNKSDAARSEALLERIGETLAKSEPSATASHVEKAGAKD